MKYPITTLNGVKCALRDCDGHLEQYFRDGNKEWCPWVPNPEYPGTKEWIIDFDGTPIDPPIVWRHQKLIAQGIHELDSLLEWANHYFKP
jgi:hypothetical protein